jgi:FKBP-type peptidyl-prolyl cis-trans isomerase
VTATGAFGVSPKLFVPTAAPGSDLFTKTVIQGTGKPLTTSDALIGNFVLYDWSGTTHKLIGSTFSGGNGPTLFSTNQMLAGLKTALIGQKIGSRVVAVLPPQYAFGTAGNSQIGVKGTDTLVYVVDLVSTVGNSQSASGTTVSTGGGSLPTVSEAPGKAAVITIPKATAPKTLTVKTLVKGSGAAVVKGDYVVVQYTGVIWRTGKVFDSTWSRATPFSFSIGAGQVVKGWDQGLIGQTVGSRVMLVIPPAEGYGSAGASQAGIKGTDTIVFVVDILGSFKPTK